MEDDTRSRNIESCVRGSEILCRVDNNVVKKRERGDGWSVQKRRRMRTNRRRVESLVLLDTFMKGFSLLFAHIRFNRRVFKKGINDHVVKGQKTKLPRRLAKNRKERIVEHSVVPLSPDMFPNLIRLRSLACLSIRMLCKIFLMMRTFLGPMECNHGRKGEARGI